VFEDNSAKIEAGNNKQNVNAADAGLLPNKNVEDLMSRGYATQTWQRVCLSNRTTKTTDKRADEEEHRTDNSGFAKKRVQWLIEHSTSHQLLWYIDRFVLRNPLLRKAAKRYKPY
jgi:hypothetical protein